MRMFLRPRWLLVHVVVIAIAVTFVSLGLWQLRRLDQRRAENARIATNMAQPAQPIDRVLDDVGNDPEALAYRRVVVEGRYEPADEFLLTPRSQGRQAGHHVVTPLLLDGDTAVLVNRGWVPFEENTPPITRAEPPPGQVTVTGLLIPTQEAVRYGSANGGDDRVTFMSTVDVDLVQPQVSTTLHPFAVQLVSQQPEGGDVPVPAPAPRTDEGSHLSYAWQWFSFTAILLIGYPLLLRRSLRSARDQDGDD